MELSDSYYFFRKYDSCPRSVPDYGTSSDRNVTRPRLLWTEDGVNLSVAEEKSSDSPRFIERQKFWGNDPRLSLHCKRVQFMQPVSWISGALVTSRENNTNHPHHYSVSGLRPRSHADARLVFDFTSLSTVRLNKWKFN